MAGLTCYRVSSSRIYRSHMIGDRLQPDGKAMQQPQQGWSGDRNRSDRRGGSNMQAKSRRVFNSLFRRYSVNRPFCWLLQQNAVLLQVQVVSSLTSMAHIGFVSTSVLESKDGVSVENT